MKRVLSMIMTLVLVASLVSVIALSVTASSKSEIGKVEAGYKPAENAVAINSAADFANMAADGNYYLAADIQITATYVADFTGTLDGNGKTVTVTAPLFKNLKGTVKNLRIAGTVNVSDYDAGALAQRADGAKVTNVLNLATVTGAKAVIAEEYAYTNLPAELAEGQATKDTVKLAGTGGLVGSATGVCEFTTCCNEGTVTGSPAGGIVGVMGYNPATASISFFACQNIGTVTDEGVSNLGQPDAAGEDRGLGGIAGYAYDVKAVTFENCTNTGVVDATKEVSETPKSITGGIFGGVGRAYGTPDNNALLKVIGCTNEGTVKGSGRTGGIVGFAGKAALEMDNCHNKATATVESTTSYAGGIISRGSGVITIIKNCTNESGAIVSKSGQSAGIIAYLCADTDYANESYVSLVENCKNLVDLVTEIDVGGVVSCVGANTYVKLVNCENTGNITTTLSGKRAGGIVGYANNGAFLTVIGCKNTGNVTSNNEKAAGIVCNAGVTTVEDCVNTGNISGNCQIGGIIGKSQELATVKNCVNSGTITGTNTLTDGSSGRGACGGIIGYANKNLDISGCVNTGVVYTGRTCAGGIVGHTNGAGSIVDCYNKANITGSADVGGIIGRFGNAKDQGQEVILRCGTEGDITAFSADDIGGIVGYVYGGTTEGLNETIIKYCYVIGNISGKAPAGAIGYVNSNALVEVKYNYFLGTLTDSTGAGNTAAISWNRANPANVAYSNNYYLEGYATYEHYNDKAADACTPANPILKADQVASGELCYLLNEAAKAADATITADIFYQNLGADGDANPVLDATHKAVIKNGDKYENQTTPDSGDAMIAVCFAMATVSVVGMAVVISKKRKLSK